MPQISVLMPVRDGERWVGASIDSVLAQTFSDFELIIVDDGSTDATPAILADYAARDRRIIVMAQAAAGLVKALNKGLAAARAPLLARLDADDIAEPTRLTAQFDEMARRPELGLLGSWASEIDEQGHTRGVRRPEVEPVKLKDALNRGNSMIHSAVMFRTAMACETGGYRDAFTAAEDYDLWLRLAERSGIGNLDRELTRYRVHDGSVTARKALLQLFSTRLAQRSATLRRSGRADPLDEIDGPFDLWADPPRAYAEIVALYRLLAWASPENIPSAQRKAVSDFGRLLPSKLSRRERGLAQTAMLLYLADHPEAPRFAFWLKIVALRPLRALSLIGRQIFNHGAEGSR